ncbi:cadherin domain-containing protein [Microvirga sp. CF3062]|uniref:cadherin domain-containing protein n=1 Tax=Microvirga sp. CF3062 TaxID=3110182 RepID=UPI002E78C946|nr:cadherin domain-containing protein [Microvirga sp. CF3062]MEE1656572.1 cadherin domain-containing protein [Microvirga sp. CF3062]
MPNIIYTNLDQLPPSGTEARLELAGFGLVVIDLDITSDTGAVIKANETDHILIRKDRTITGQTDGIVLTGHSSTITNEGSIRSLSETGAAIRLSGAVTYSVVNSGTITSAGLAIQGSAGVDRIINAGTLQTASNSANAVLLDLGAGNDLFEGVLGTATGGTIKLGLGNDTAFGGAGSEIFSGGAGDDVLFGGGGSDTADYSEATGGGVNVDLSRTTAQTIHGNQGVDILIDIENVIGSSDNDTLIGNTGQNVLKGGGGQDVLQGGSGNDTLEGGDGNDVLDGGQGNDLLDGGAGTNTARYTGSSGAKVDLRIVGAQDTGSYGSDTLAGIVNLEGGSGADHFIGSDENNRLNGAGGNNTLEGGKGNDTLTGGSGENTAVFSGASGEYNRVKNDDGTFTITHARGTQADGTDTLKDVRLVKFSDTTLALTNANPTDISLSGTSVSEDKAVGSVLGTPRGTDPDDDDLTFSLVSNPNGIFGLNSSGELVLLKALDYEAAAQHTIMIKAEDKYGGVLTETFTINVRNVVETTPLVHSGTSKGEQVTGESGHDRLFGLGGNDALFGQIGNDTLAGGTGKDTLVGGTGRDVFVFDQRPNAKSNLDYIQDFNPADDTVHLSRKIFTKIAKGALSSKAFVTGNQFKDEDDRILYYKQGGALFYDPDGSGSAKAIQFASLSKNLKISHKDFFVI